MKTDIYYFSGSGNSLAIAQNLSNKIEHSRIISIPNVINKTENITGEIIGIVCPIYFHNIPHIVRDFIRKIEGANYTFMVYAGAGELGIGAKAARKLFSSQNIKLSSLFNIRMPDNSTRYGEITEEKQKEIFDLADKKTEDIVKKVNSGSEHSDSNNTGLLQTYIFPGIIMKLLHGSMKNMDNKFHTDENCNGCSTCSKVCPVKNITMKNNRPEWSNTNCQVCLACHDWCPKKSIKHPSTKNDIKRYHNPNISLADIISSSSENNQQE